MQIAQNLIILWRAFYVYGNVGLYAWSVEPARLGEPLGSVSRWQNNLTKLFSGFRRRKRAIRFNSNLSFCFNGEAHSRNYVVNEGDVASSPKLSAAAQLSMGLITWGGK